MGTHLVIIILVLIIFVMQYRTEESGLEYYQFGMFECSNTSESKSPRQLFSHIHWTFKPGKVCSFFFGQLKTLHVHVILRLNLWEDHVIVFTSVGVYQVTGGRWCEDLQPIRCSSVVLLKGPSGCSLPSLVDKHVRHIHRLTHHINNKNNSNRKNLKEMPHQRQQLLIRVPINSVFPRPCDQQRKFQWGGDFGWIHWIFIYFSSFFYSNKTATANRFLIYERLTWAGRE